jgi:hypothetical protein
MRSDWLAAAEYVAPYAGAWIEIDLVPASVGAENTSHPTRVRGLKYAMADVLTDRKVAPYAGAWIEMVYLISFYVCQGRTLRGCVD